MHGCEGASLQRGCDLVSGAVNPSPQEHWQLSNHINHAKASFSHLVFRMDCKGMVTRIPECTREHHMIWKRANVITAGVPAFQVCYHMAPYTCVIWFAVVLSWWIRGSGLRGRNCQPVITGVPLHFRRRGAVME